MEYIVKVRETGDANAPYCHFKESSVEGIAALAAKLPGCEFLIETVGHAIETIHHPQKSCLIQAILGQTMDVPPCEAPFSFPLYCWHEYANEAIIRWTFDHVITMFKIVSIETQIATKNCGRVRYTVTVGNH